MTNQTSSGQTASERLQETERKWDEQDSHLGLPNLRTQIHSQTENILSMNPEEIARLTLIECGEAATLLSLVALQFQRLYNRESAKMLWADACVKKLLAKALPRTPGYSYDERRQLALSDNARAMEFEVIRLEAQLRAEQLNFLSAKISEVKKVLLEKQKGRSHD